MCVTEYDPIDLEDLRLCEQLLTPNIADPIEHGSQIGQFTVFQCLVQTVARRPHIPVTNVIGRAIFWTDHVLTSWRKAANEISRIHRPLQSIYVVRYDSGFGANIGCSWICGYIAEDIFQRLLVVLHATW